MFPEQSDFEIGNYNNESRSVLEGNAGLYLSRAATLKQNISANSDQKTTSQIKFNGSISGNSTEIVPSVHTKSRDKLHLTSSHNQSRHNHNNQIPYFLTGTQSKNQTTNIKILSQDNSSNDPNDQIMSLYQELARKN